jgi:hypothetical protein
VHLRHYESLLRCEPRAITAVRSDPKKQRLMLSPLQLWACSVVRTINWFSHFDLQKTAVLAEDELYSLKQPFQQEIASI